MHTATAMLCCHMKESWHSAVWYR